MSNNLPRPIQLDDLFAIKTVSDVQLAPDGTRCAYVLSEVDTTADDYRTTIWVVCCDGGEPVQFTRGPRHDSAPRWSPDGKYLCFLSDRGGEAACDAGAQLYVIATDGGEARKLTALDPAAGPAVWSPDGTRLLFAAQVFAEAPPQDRQTRERWTLRPRHVMRAQYKAEGAGYTFDKRTHLFVTRLDTGETAQITHGDDEATQPAWSPDGRRIAFCRPRTGVADLSLTDIWVADADGQSARQITTTVGRASLPAWSPDGALIACLGTDEQEATYGDFHYRLWLVPAAGGPAQCLTAGYDRPMVALPSGSTPFSGSLTSPDSTTLTCLAADAGNNHVLRVALQSGAVQTVVGGARTFTSMSFSPGTGSGTGAGAGPGTDCIAFIASQADNPGDVYVCNGDGSGERRLTNVNADLLARWNLPRVERRTFDSPHGLTLDGWVIHPTSEARSGSYPAPLLVDIHGGPASYYGDGFSIGSFFRYVLASQGWAVLYLNPSGSGSYGKAFMQSLRGRWGEYDLPEQLAAVDALCAEGIADRDRLAVAGYSYGGYMAAWTIGHTGRYKAAVIGAPVINLESFHGTSDIGTWFTGWYAPGDLASHREIYRRMSPINYVEQVTTPALILHGEADDRCPIGQGEEFYTGLVAAGRVPVEFVRYPGSSHSFFHSGRPSHRLDYQRRVVEWVQRYTLEP
jgi:dipeptidyl aminopeptidase/acylaminoacyl peptidase